MDPDSAQGFCCVLSPLHPFCCSEPHSPRSIDGPFTEEKHRLGKMNIVCPNVPRLSVGYGECRPFLCSRPPVGGSPRPHDQDAVFAFSFVLFPRPSREYKTVFAFALDLGLFLFCLFYVKPSYTFYNNLYTILLTKAIVGVLSSLKDILAVVWSNFLILQSSN